ncbi:hypothetical protein B0A52_09408 [Exophiala mesophila]|uniref:Major facilitator superfamily (MFS) profile domain-containing protein n=1 Tax=Exophiala mesophila TaxID=212818 RepID=A0A438MSM8_EXOME|nr:hypothetical protein B0A52_09408 [Exophiala mesophila]
MVSAPKSSQFSDAALQRRLALVGKPGPQAILRNIRVFGIASFACIGGLLYGYNQGVFSGVLTMNSFNKHMGDYTTNSTKKGWLTSILELGAWTGTMYSGFLAELISRKYAIIVNTVIFILGVVVQCTAREAGHSAILGGRFVVGMGVGSLSMIIPMYVAECAPPELRGFLIGIQQLAIEFGIMVSFWIDYGTNFIGGTGDGQSDAAWLVPLALQLAPAVILLVGMFFMPFTPRWLIHHGHEEDARKTLALLRAMPVENELIDLEFLEIKAQSLFEKRTVEANFPHLAEMTTINIIKLQFVAIGSLFKTMPMFRRVIVATVTMFFQQWTGKMGRKPALALGALGMGLCHFIIAVIFAKNEKQWETHQAAAWAAIVMVWLFVVHFGWSWGPCAWIVVAEVFPLSSRSYGIALGASSNWMNNFIVGQVTPDMIVHLRYGTFILFGMLITIGAGFIWFYVPETKQLTLEEMDIIFGSSGVAAADQERMAQINAEIGLDRRLQGSGHGSDEHVGEVTEKGGLSKEV